jgi:hypothetical protein
MNKFRIIIISIVILVILYIYQMTSLINNNTSQVKLSNCLTINKINNNYSIEENDNNKLYSNKVNVNNNLFSKEVNDNNKLYSNEVNDNNRLYSNEVNVNNRLYSNEVNVNNNLSSKEVNDNNKLYSNEINVNNNLFSKEVDDNLNSEECLIYEDFNNIQEKDIGINNNIKLNKLYYGLDCNYEKAGCFYETLIKNNFKMTKNITEASLIVPCTYETIEKEISELKKKHIQKNIYGKDVRIFMLGNTDYLVSKIVLWLKIKEGYGKKIAQTIMPYTWDLNNINDVNDFRKNYKKNRLYITKNNNQRQEGLLIQDNVDEICNSKDTYLLVQELLQDPYLINNRKINLRIYCLFIKDSKGNSKTCLYQDGFMYYTADFFEKNNKNFKKNITTGYIDRKVYEENPLTHEDFRKYLDSDRELSDIEKYIRSKNIKISDYIFTNIYMLLKMVFEIYLEIIGHENPGVGFQLYGADVAINDKLKPLLMEINKGPDLRAKDGRDKQLKLKLSEDILNLVGLLPDVKNNKFINILENVNINNDIIKIDNYTNLKFL